MNNITPNNNLDNKGKKRTGAEKASLVFGILGLIFQVPITVCVLGICFIGMSIESLIVFFSNSYTGTSLLPGAILGSIEGIGDSAIIMFGLTIFVEIPAIVSNILAVTVCRASRKKANKVKRSAGEICGIIGIITFLVTLFCLLAFFAIILLNPQEL